MARSVFIAVFLLGAIDLYAAEQPEIVEQKPEYTRTRELPALKISFTDMESDSRSQQVCFRPPT
jgi:hypothetical protein